MIEHIIADEDNGIRLDRWFKRYMPEVQHALLEKSLRKGQVRLKGKKSASSTRLETGQGLRVDFEVEARFTQMPRKDEAFIPSEAQLKAIRNAILYEDERMLILNKPSGLAVQGGSGQKSHLDAMLPHLARGGKGALKLVHRLDKDTSGVLILAKGAQAAEQLSKLFARKNITKIYLALVAGVPNPREGTIDLPLAKDERGKHSGIAAYERVGVDMTNGQRAITEYRVLDAIGKKLAWVELRPITGRTHQLRVHMEAINCPIIGDGKYGGPEAFMKDLGLPEQLHLHAQRIIIDSWHGKTIDVSAPLPAHMKKSKALLGE